MDIRVGVWRGVWPTNLTSIIALEPGVLLRHSRRDRLLDIMQVDETTSTATKFSDAQLGSLDVPLIGSIHHFSVRTGAYLFCVSDDRRKFVVFPLPEGRRFGNPTVGLLPVPASHCVVFRYRSLNYALLYVFGTGEFVVVSLAALASADPNMTVVVRGRFRPGWTDIVWKGTHHVRCTRQKFFCYNAANGDVAFECVWVRGASTSSSIVSAEHVTMEVTKNASSGNATENELSSVLRQKGCLVVPLALGGRVACLLYSHSSLAAPASPSQQRGGQSTGRLPGLSNAMASRALSAVAQSTSLMLQKTIFAHQDPWTHFAMLRDVGEEPSPADNTKSDEGSATGKAGNASQPLRHTLLCYSATTGAVWVSLLFASDVPERETTVVDDGLGGGVGRGLTRDALRDLGEGGGVDVDEYTRGTRRGTTLADPDGSYDAHQQHPHHQRSQHHHGGAAATGTGRGTGGPTTPRRRKADGGVAAGSDGQGGGGGSDGVGSGGGGGGGAAQPLPPVAVRMPQRPASSSTHLRDRLSALSATWTGASENFSADFASVVKYICDTDFPRGSLVAKRALELPLPESETDILGDTNNTARGGGQSGGGDGGDETSEGGTGSPQWRPSTAGSGSGLLKGGKGIQPPWREASPGVASPSPRWLVKFEKGWETHIEEEVPQLKLTNQKMMTLYKPPRTREAYQEKQLQASDKALAAASIGTQGPQPAEAVEKTIERLGVSDVKSRQQKADGLAKKYLHSPKPPKQLTEADFEAHVRRVAVDAVERQRAAHQKALRAVAPRGQSPPLNAAARAALTARLGVEDLAWRLERREKLVQKHTAPPS